MARVGVFIPWKSANPTNGGFCFCLLEGWCTSTLMCLVDVKFRASSTPTVLLKVLSRPSKPCGTSQRACRPQLSPSLLQAPRTALQLQHGSCLGTESAPWPVLLTLRSHESQEFPSQGLPSQDPAQRALSPPLCSLAWHQPPSSRPHFLPCFCTVHTGGNAVVGFRVLVA